MSRLFITNTSIRSVSSMMYSGKVCRFEPHTCYSILTSDDHESKFYIGFKSMGLLVGTQPANNYPIRGLDYSTEDSNSVAESDSDSNEIDITDHEDTSDTVIETTEAVADQILENQLNDKLSTNDADVTELLVDIQTDDSGRSLSELDASEYKTILNKLGVVTTVRSTSKLRELVLTNLPSDKDWKLMLVEGDD